VLEYFWKAAHCFHKAGTPAVEQWVSQKLRALRSSGDFEAYWVFQVAAARSRRPKCET